MLMSADAGQNSRLTGIYDSSCRSLAGLAAEAPPS